MKISKIKNLNTEYRHREFILTYTGIFGDVWNWFSKKDKWNNNFTKDIGILV